MLLTNYQRLLSDPCNAHIEGFYGGDTGIVQRFVSDITVNAAAGFTAGYVSFVPAGNYWLYAGAAAANTPLTATNNFQGPAATWLATAANKFRSVAACLQMIPSSVSITNITGELACAVIAANNITTGTSLSVDAVFQLCNDRAVIEKRDYEAKWFPGALDSTYAPVFGTGIGAGTGALTDASDHNAIVIAWRGYPAGSGVSMRLTNVLEWCPNAGVGLAAQSEPRAPYPVHLEAAALHKKSPSWWNNFKHKYGHQLLSVGEKVLVRGIEKGAEYALEAMG
jgi:hypothetical protein